MADLCDCGSGLGNLGQPNCFSKSGVPKKLVFVEYFDNDGVQNSIPVGTSLTDVFMQGKINELDTSKRFYFSPEIDSVETAKGDTVFETLSSGTSYRVKEGVRTFSCVFVDGDPVFLGKLKKNICVKMGVYEVDNVGNLVGASSDGVNLYPRLISSFNPTLVYPTDEAIGKVALSFEFSQLEKDEDIRFFAASDFEVGLLTYRGLKDVTLAEVSSSTTTLVVTAEFKSGDAKNTIPIEGRDSTADWVLTNTTGAAVVTVSTVTEAPAGTYTLDYTGDTQTGAEAYSLDLVADGFEAVALTGTF